MRVPHHHRAGAVSWIAILVVVSFAGVAFNPASLLTSEGDRIQGTSSGRALTVSFAPAEEREDGNEDDLDDVVFDDAEHHRAPPSVRPTSVAPRGLTSLLVGDRLHRPPIG